MINNFENTKIVLTSQFPEAFLTLNYEASDTSILYIIPRRNENIPPKSLYINALDINDLDSSIYDISIGYALLIDPCTSFPIIDPSTAVFHIYTRDTSKFDYNLQLDVYDTSALQTILLTYDISIWNRPYIISSDEINIFENSNIMVDGDTSYMLIRTNPKYTGNIKLIIDSSDNLYLDTFKVSDILSHKKYRKQSISSNSVFSGDVRKVFETLPLGEMYKLGKEDTLNISIPKTNYIDQYNLEYSYGTRLLQDELYIEDNALLAPLWINNTLPDYFAIFRLEGVYNTETYNNESLDNLANKYLEKSYLINSYSFKKNAPLGNYFRNYLKELLQFKAPVFLSLSDPAASDSDPNTWYGIAIDKGIITGRSEIPYFFDLRSHNFTEMNAFISEGFERNNLLCPNLINMEYIFNDEDVSTYTMNRYFGLYLTENELYKIAYYADTSVSNIEIISLDNKDSSVFFNSSIFDSDGSINSAYKNRIFGINDAFKITRILNKNQGDGSDNEKLLTWLNKPYKNIFSEEVKLRENINPFISIKINNILNPGEHLRIINNSQGGIWEIYGTDTSILKPGESWTYASTSDSSTELYRVAFSTLGIISDQVSAMKKAFDVFKDYTNTPFRTTVQKENTISLDILDFAYGDNFIFQRLTSQTENIPGDENSIMNSSGAPEDITFFGSLTPTVNDFERINAYDTSYGPIDFELYGNRMSIKFDLLDASGYYTYSLDSSALNAFENTILYLGDNNWYKRIQTFDISTLINHNLQYATDPFTSEDKIIIITEEIIRTVRTVWNAYSIYPLSISLMGINPVKDIDFTVYDSSTLNFKSEYWYKREDDISTYQLTKTPVADFGSTLPPASYKIIEGEGNITIGSNSTIYIVNSPSSIFNFNTFNASVNIDPDTDTTIVFDILDGSTTFTSYKEGKTEEIIEDYYDNSLTKQKLKYGLTIPYVSKWVGLGTDCRGNDLRLILNNDIFFESFATWNNVEISSTPPRWFTIIYAGGQFVATGSRDPVDASVISTSLDGENWIDHPMPGTVSQYYRGLAYNDASIYVGVGNATSGVGSIISEDGSIWFTTQLFDGTWESVTYGNNLFVAVGRSTSGDGNRAQTSIDGSIWYPGNIASSAWNEVTYGNGIYVAVGNNGACANSTDGSTWYSSDASEGDWRSIIYGNNQFVAVGEDSGSTDIMVSVDGSNWSFYDSPEGVNDWQSIIYANNYYTAVADNGNNNRFMYSEDGSIWAADKLPNRNYTSIAYGNDRYVIISNDRLALISEVKNILTNFIPFSDKFNDELTFPVFKYLDTGERAWKSYIYYDLNDIISIDNSINSTLKDYMINNPSVDVFSKLVYSGKNAIGIPVRSSLVYYNLYKDTIDVILNGLNISLLVNSSAKSIIDTKDWDRYKFSFISTPYRNKDYNNSIEVFINENNKSILMIWYLGSDDLNYNRRFSSIFGGKNLLDVSGGVDNFSGFNDDPLRSNIKSLFVVGTTQINPVIINTFGTSTSGYDSSLATSYFQLNWNYGAQLYSIFNPYGGNSVLSSGLFSFEVSYDTFDQYINYTYTGNSTTFSSTATANFGYQYNKNNNLYSNNTGDLNSLKSILESNDIHYYIMRGETVYRNKDFETKPINISINNPRLYTPVNASTGIYMYNGWFRPHFQNILEFNTNEVSNIINITKKDFSLSNTSLKKYNNIHQYWYNKVVETVTADDVSTADAINYLTNYNIFKAQWDQDYYILNDASLIDGHNAPLELPSYFGSKVPKLPNKLILKYWDNTTAESTDEENFNTFKFNFTRVIINQFKNENAFISNWIGLENVTASIDKYIKNTVLSYYNISKAKIEVNVYIKNYDGTRLYLELNNTLILDSKKNFDGNLNYINGEYIYNIQTNLTPNLSYYFDFTLTEK